MHRGDFENGICPHATSQPTESTGGSSSDPPVQQQPTRVSTEPKLQAPPAESDDEQVCVTCGAEAASKKCTRCQKKMCEKCWKFLKGTCMQCRGSERDEQVQLEQQSPNNPVPTVKFESIKSLNTYFEVVLHQQGRRRNV